MNGELCLPLFCVVATPRALAGLRSFLTTGRRCMEVTRLALTGALYFGNMALHIILVYCWCPCSPCVFHCESSLRLSNIMMVSMILCSDHIILSVPCVAGFLVLGQLCRRF